MAGLHSGVSEITIACIKVPARTPNSCRLKDASAARLPIILLIVRLEIGGTIVHKGFDATIAIISATVMDPVNVAVIITLEAVNCPLFVTKKFREDCPGGKELLSAKSVQICGGFEMFFEVVGKVESNN